MKFVRLCLVVAVVAVLGVATAASAQADPIDLELALVIDGSGSISGADFLLQRGAYATSLAALIPTDGSVAVGVWQFSHVFQTVFTTQVIANAGDLASLIGAVNGMNQIGGGTLIGGAITTARLDLLGNAIDSTRQIIDVSTDGVSADDAGAAATIAVGLGIEQVNGLGIGVVTTFHRGVDSFSINAASFADFADAIDTKLAIELGGEVPEPSTVALFGLGVLGLALYRRRRVA